MDSTTTNRLKVGIIFGGRSEEHPISVKSAQEIARNLDTAKYEPFYVGVTREGAWKLCAAPDAEWENGPCRPAMLSPDSTVRGLLVQLQAQAQEEHQHPNPNQHQIPESDRYKTIPLDVIVPVLHGRLGEDGATQGLLELSGIPYVGCDVQSSALCMDKSLAYVVAGNAGIATPNFWTVPPGGTIDPAPLIYPVFVKPARSGSSFGVTKVSRAEELPGALENARRYDAKVLIEEAVTGSEIGCAVLGDEEDLMTGEVDRIALSHGFFRIHQEDAPETGSDNSTAIVPADIPAESRRLVQQTAMAVYRALGCRGLARVDLFLTERGAVVLNEVNTFPGMTSYSRYPRMMAAAGVPLGEVIDRTIALALNRKPR
ncbi:D-alanine--(R)-lactate ligase [Streptomyces sp. NPDC093085]|uniref:D-alanine--(R)-lactate ligase n=1 Tax=Streptomyces sp. NPDC093085 TaxID=3155068 RepID=UPI0034210101